MSLDARAFPNGKIRRPAPTLTVPTAQDPAAPDHEEDHAARQEACQQRRARLQRGDREAIFKSGPFPLKHKRKGLSLCPKKLQNCF